MNIVETIQRAIGLTNDPILIRDLQDLSDLIVAGHTVTDEQLWSVVWRTRDNKPLFNLLWKEACCGQFMKRNGESELMPGTNKEHAAYDACFKAFSPQFPGDRSRFEEADIRFSFMSLWYRLYHAYGSDHPSLDKLREVWMSLPRR